MKLTIIQSKAIEEYWKNYKHYLKEADFRYWEVLQKQNHDTNTGGGRSSNISDTTGSSAVKLMNDVRYQHLKRVTKAVESVYETLDEEAKDIVNARYWNEDGVIEWVDMKDYFFISRATVYRIRENIINKTAEKLGWL